MSPVFIFVTQISKIKFNKKIENNCHWYYSFAPPLLHKEAGTSFAVLWGDKLDAISALGYNLRKESSFS